MVRSSWPNLAPRTWLRRLGMLRLRSVSVARPCPSYQRFAGRRCHLMDFPHPDSVRRLRPRRLALCTPWLPFVACATEHLEPVGPSLACCYRCRIVFSWLLGSPQRTCSMTLVRILIQTRRQTAALAELKKLLCGRHVSLATRPRIRVRVPQISHHGTGLSYR